MALNKNIKQKIADKTAEDQAVQDAIISLLKGVDEGNIYVTAFAGTD